MIQLILHMLGDYVLQSDWMAQNKTKASFPAFVHALIYSLPFLLIGSAYAWAVIFVTHFFIDRFRLARFVVFAKEFLSPTQVLHYSYHWPGEESPRTYSSAYSTEDDAAMRPIHPDMSVAPPFARKLWVARPKWSDCKTTGYPSEKPAWLAVWLLIAADNTLHLAINYAALLWL